MSNTTVRSPILFLLTLALAMAGDWLHWSGYVLAALVFVWGLIAMGREIDIEARKESEE